MAAAIGPVSPSVPNLEGLRSKATQGETGDFAGYLVDTLEQARSAETKADDMAERFANGDPDVGIHEVMIATERATVMLRYAVTLKNKAIEAYRELMNTPL